MIDRNNKVMLHIYSDGTVEKIINKRVMKIEIILSLFIIFIVAKK